MRVIDADDLKKTWYKEHNIEPGESGAMFVGNNEVPMFIDRARTIDAVPVVRCKDCFLYGECQAAKFYGDDGYCSVGERKDDDKSRDTCKYYDDDWCSGACDGCPRNPSYWERKDK